MTTTTLNSGFFRNEQPEFAGFMWKTLAKQRPAVVSEPQAEIEEVVAAVEKREERFIAPAYKSGLGFECDSWMRWTQS